MPVEPVVSGSAGQFPGQLARTSEVLDLCVSLSLEASVKTLKCLLLLQDGHLQLAPRKMGRQQAAQLRQSSRKTLQGVQAPAEQLQTAATLHPVTTLSLPATAVARAIAELALRDNWSMPTRLAALLRLLALV